MKTQGARRWWALAAVSLGVLAVGLDGTVLSVALPTLAKALHASESDLQWFTSGYFLVLAAAMLPAGLLGDRFGRKKVLPPPSRSSVSARRRAPIPRRWGSSSRLASARPRRRRSGGDGALGADRAVQPGGASQGGRDLGRGELPVAPGRPDPRRLDALALLVGLGLSHQRACSGARLVALVTLVPESRAAHRPGLDLVASLSVAGLVVADLWVDRGGSAGMGRFAALLAMSAALLCSPPSGSGSGASTGVPAASRSSTQPLRFGVLHVGRDPRGGRRPRHDRRALHDAPVLPGRARHRRDGLGPAAAAGDRRPRGGAIPAERSSGLRGPSSFAAGFLLLALGLFLGSTTGVASAPCSSRRGWQWPAWASASHIPHRHRLRSWS